MLKTLSKLGIKANFFNPIKGTYDQPASNITTVKSRIVSPKIRNKAKMSAFTNFTQHCIRGSSQCNRARKEIKEIQIIKKV